MSYVLEKTRLRDDKERETYILDAIIKLVRAVRPDLNISTRYLGIVDRDLFIRHKKGQKTFKFIKVGYSMNDISREEDNTLYLSASVIPRVVDDEFKHFLKPIFAFLSDLEVRNV